MDKLTSAVIAMIKASLPKNIRELDVIKNNNQVVLNMLDRLILTVSAYHPGLAS
jgi:hypothetical protein